MTNKKKYPYYNYNKLLSYGATYNFLIGLRGLGKTYGAKKRAIKAALEKDEEFILLRRYKTELDGRGTFFSDLVANNEFPDWDLKIMGHTAVGARVSTRSDKKREWKILGHFIALSTAATKKGVSYHNVRTIIFDEFIIDKKGMHRYLNKESTLMNDFYSTVDRGQDRVRVFFLANAVSIMNPYFIEYKISPDKLKEFSTHFNGFIAIHFDDSQNFRDEFYQTKFGRFIQGTEYAEYSMESKFKDNHDLLIDYKPSDAKYILTLETKQGTFSVWLHFMTGTYYMRAKRPKNEVHATLLQENVRQGKPFLERSNRRLQLMRAAFNNGRMFFETPTERNAFTEVFKQS